MWKDSNLPTISECKEVDTQWDRSLAPEATSPRADTDRGKTELQPNQSPSLGIDRIKQEKMEDWVTVIYIRYATNEL